MKINEVKWLPWTNYANEQHSKQLFKQKIQNTILGATLLCVVLGVIVAVM